MKIRIPDDIASHIETARQQLIAQHPQHAGMIDAVIAEFREKITAGEMNFDEVTDLCPQIDEFESIKKADPALKRSIRSSRQRLMSVISDLFRGKVPVVYQSSAEFRADEADAWKNNRISTKEFQRISARYECSGALRTLNERIKEHVQKHPLKTSTAFTNELKQKKGEFDQYRKDFWKRDSVTYPEIKEYFLHLNSITKLSYRNMETVEHPGVNAMKKLYEVQLEMSEQYIDRYLQEQGLPEDQREVRAPISCTRDEVLLDILDKILCETESDLFFNGLTPSQNQVFEEVEADNILQTSLLTMNLSDYPDYETCMNFIDAYVTLLRNMQTRMEQAGALLDKDSMKNFESKIKEALDTKFLQRTSCLTLSYAEFNAEITKTMNMEEAQRAMSLAVELEELCKRSGKEAQECASQLEIRGKELQADLEKQPYTYIQWMRHEKLVRENFEIFLANVRKAGVVVPDKMIEEWNAIFFDSLSPTIDTLFAEKMEKKEADPDAWKKSSIPQGEFQKILLRFDGGFRIDALYKELKDAFVAEGKPFPLYGRELSESGTQLDDYRKELTKKKEVAWEDWQRLSARAQAHISLCVHAIEATEFTYPATQAILKFYAEQEPRLHAFMEEYFRESVLPPEQRKLSAKTVLYLPRNEVITLARNQKALAPINLHEKMQSATPLQLLAINRTRMDDSHARIFAEFELPEYPSLQDCYAFIDAFEAKRADAEGCLTNIGVQIDPADRSESTIKKLKEKIDQKFLELTENITITADEFFGPAAERAQQADSDFKDIHRAFEEAVVKAGGKAKERVLVFQRHEEERGRNFRAQNTAFTYPQVVKDILDSIADLYLVVNDLRDLGVEVPEDFVAMRNKVYQEDLHFADKLFKKKLAERNDTAAEKKNGKAEIVKKADIKIEDTTSILRDMINAHTGGQFDKDLIKAMGNNGAAYSTLFTAAATGMGVSLFNDPALEQNAILDKEKLLWSEREWRQILCIFLRESFSLVPSEALNLHNELTQRFEKAWSSFVQEIEKRYSAPWIQEWKGERNALVHYYPKPKRLTMPIRIYMEMCGRDILTSSKGVFRDFEEPALTRLKPLISALTPQKKQSWRKFLYDWKQEEESIYSKLIKYDRENRNFSSAQSLKDLFTYWKELRKPMYENLKRLDQRILRHVIENFDRFEEFMIAKAAEICELPGMPQLLTEREKDRKEEEEDRETQKLQKQARVRLKRSESLVPMEDIEEAKERIRALCLPLSPRKTSIVPVMTDLQIKLDEIYVRPEKRWGFVEAWLCGEMRHCFDMNVKKTAAATFLIGERNGGFQSSCGNLTSFSDEIFSEVKKLFENANATPSFDKIIQVIDTVVGKRGEDNEGENWLRAAKYGLREIVWNSYHDDLRNARLLSRQEILNGVRERLRIPPGEVPDARYYKADAFLLPPGEIADSRKKKSAENIEKERGNLGGELHDALVFHDIPAGQAIPRLVEAAKIQLSQAAGDALAMSAHQLSSEKLELAVVALEKAVQAVSEPVEKALKDAPVLNAESVSGIFAFAFDAAMESASLPPEILEAMRNAIEERKLLLDTAPDEDALLQDLLETDAKALDTTAQLLRTSRDETGIREHNQKIQQAQSAINAEIRILIQIGDLLVKRSSGEKIDPGVMENLEQLLSYPLHLQALSGIYGNILRSEKNDDQHKKS